MTEAAGGYVLSTIGKRWICNIGISKGSFSQYNENGSHNSGSSMDAGNLKETKKERSINPNTRSHKAHIEEADSSIQAIGHLAHLRGFSPSMLRSQNAPTGAASGDGARHYGDTVRSIQQDKRDSSNIKRNLGSSSNFRKALARLHNTRKHLDNLDKLGYGIKYRQAQLDQIAMLNVDNERDENAASRIKDVLCSWISFESRFRETYSRVAKAYHQLRQMEVNINLLRTNSLYMLETDDADGSGSGVALPLSARESIRNSELYGKLVSIWYTKLSELRSRNIQEFRQYVIDAASAFSHLPVPRAIQFVEEVQEQPDALDIRNFTSEPPAKTLTAVESFDFVEDGDTTEADGLTSTCKADQPALQDETKELDYRPTFSMTSSGVMEYSLEEEDEAADYCEDEEPDDCDSILAEIKEIFSEYRRIRGINEESAVDYTGRLTDLRSRLIPRFLKVSDKIPAYRDAYANVFYETNPRDAHDYCKHLTTGKAQTGNTSVRRNVNRQTYQVASKLTTKEALRSARNHGQHHSLPRWAQENSVVSMFKRTHLRIVDALRCSPNRANNQRRLIVISNGTTKDLFLNAEGTESVTNVDVSSIIKAGPSDASHGFFDQGNEKAMIVPKPLSKSVMRALLTEDLAEDEINKVLSTWFPPLRWEAESPVGQRTNEEKHVETPRWYPSSVDLTGEIREIQKESWLSRLRMFHSFDSKQKCNLLQQQQLLEPRIKYDSSCYPSVSDFPPLRATADFNNHIVIKYTMKSTNNPGNNTWIQSLFGGNPINLASDDEECHNKSPETDHIPICNPFQRMNAVLVPIHKGAIERSGDYCTIVDMCECTTDYVYPPLYEQHTFQCDGNRRNFMGNKDQQESSPGRQTRSFERNVKHGSTDTNKLGTVLFSRHSNLCLGSQWSASKDTLANGSVSLLFYLVCCEENGSLPEQLENAEDTENIRRYMDNMRPVLEGLDYILSLCLKFRVATISIPVALRCCSVEDGTESIDRSHKGKTPTPEDLETHVRCLATVTHLSTCLPRYKLPVAINMIFPPCLENSDVEKSAVSILANHLGTY